MIRKGVFAATLIFTALSSTRVEGAKPAASGGPATSIVYDSPAAAGLDPLNVQPYRIHSDLPAGKSNTYYHGVDSVTSQFQGCGCYELSTLQSNVRSLWLDLNDPVDPARPAPAEILGQARAAYVPGRFISKFGGIDTMKGVGSTTKGGLPFVFTSAVQGPQGGSADYQVRMNSANEAGTTDAVFTCTRVVGTNQADPAALCNQWMAEPAGGIGIGRLVKQETAKGKTVLTYYGDFYITFLLKITKP